MIKSIIKNSVFSFGFLALLSCSSSNITADAVNEKYGPPYGSLPNTCTIDVFYSPHCPHCSRLHAFLKARNIPYRARDVKNDYWARQDLRALSEVDDRVTGVPVTKIGNKLVVGNRQEEIEATFRNFCNVAGNK